MLREGGGGKWIGVEQKRVWGDVWGRNCGRGESVFGARSKMGLGWSGNVFGAHLGKDLGWTQRPAIGHGTPDWYFT